MSMNSIFIYFLLAILFSVVSFYSYFLLDILIRGHDLPTNKKARQALCKIIAEKAPQAKIFYDLGSGRGTVVLAVKKQLPHLRVCGLDLSRFRCFIAKAKAKFLNKPVMIKRGDLFKVGLSQADVIYAYIWYDLMPALEQKLQQELKPGAIAITNTVHFSNWPLAETIVFDEKLPGNFGTLFVYVKE